ncbi:AraC family transcriptional regulator [Streptomyces sp. NBC_01465]|uniref:AraC family transcriptional regulator n=1 Tax=Streptomyces sp. NBC_01465 TaxID=2903878 RepID=UPI002E30E1D8|nr:AraC family transcriptional regulator [Streptomyces sp. NBC_01465]
MHRVLRTEVFSAGTPTVSAERCEGLPATTRPHAHDFVELALVTAGRAVHVSAAGRRELARGSAVLLAPGDWHGYEECHDLALYNVYVDARVLRRELAWLRPGPPSDRPPHLDEDAMALAEYCLPALAGDGPSHAVRIGLLLCALGDVLGTPPEERTTPHPAVLHAARLLEDRLADPWSVDRLASCVGLSGTHLARLFTRQLGTAPMAHLGRLRAERAAALLLGTDLTVAAVGRRVGWPDPNYASRRFRRHFGLGPARYRETFRPDAP